MNKKVGYLNKKGNKILVLRRFMLTFRNMWFRLWMIQFASVSVK